MEAVRRLLGLGCAGVAGLRVGAGPVPADHLDLWVRGQPGDEGGAVAFREQIQDPVGDRIGDHRAVDVALAQSEVCLLYTSDAADE